MGACSNSRGVERPLSQLAKQPRKLVGSVVRVQAAGVGQDPDRRRADLFFLQAEVRARALKSRAVGAHPDDGEYPRLAAKHPAFEAACALAKLVVGQFSGGGAGPGPPTWGAGARGTALPPFLCVENRL